MGILTSKKRGKSGGFTITELLIVITVIGILASIAMVVYPGYQKRTRDNERKSDLQQISAAFGAYALQKGNYVDGTSTCGLSGSGNGWFNAGPADTGAGAYTKSIQKCLEEAKVLASGTFVDPSGCTWINGSGVCGNNAANLPRAYMKATCTKGGSSNVVTYLFASLESEPPQAGIIDGLCDAGSMSPSFDSNSQKWGSLYGMNYYVVVK